MNFSVNLIIIEDYLVLEINEFNYKLDIEKVYLDNNEIKIYKKKYFDNKVRLYISMEYYYLINDNSNMTLCIRDKGCLCRFDIKQFNNLSNEYINVNTVECSNDKIILR